jgi:thioester reductase-like protein
MVSISLAMEITLIIPTTGGLPTAAALAQAMKLTRIEFAFVVPSIVQELAQDSELLAYCSEHLNLLVYCGGDLPQHIGDVVASKIRLINQYGATELGLLNSIHSKSNRHPDKDWRYVSFHPQTGTKFCPVTDIEYELVVVKSPELEKYQVPFGIYTDRREYHTSDLWVRHPDPNKPDLWRWSSRMDDIIVFLNGEKTNPVSMEQHIVASNAEISGTLVAGAQRFQACLLIELNADYLKSVGISYHNSPSERMVMVEKFWPSIVEANASCPAHARIMKTHILFTSSDKPMLRAGKGTVQRAGTLMLYAQELDELYDRAEELVSNDDREISGPGLTDDIQKLSPYIVQTLSKITGLNPDQVSNTDNFFSLGLDSLQAITASRWFRYSLEFPNFTPNLIYLNPSVERLAQAIFQTRNDIKASEKVQIETHLKERNQILLECEEKIKPFQQAQQNSGTAQKHTVILTGSTGNLGGYIFNVLLNHPSVAHIHCLNRRVPTHQTSDGASDGKHFDSQRVSFWKTDFSRPDLGMKPEILAKLQEETTLIIHNAWAVNFNLSLASFKPLLSGVVNLINFCSSAVRSPHLFFISSVSSVLGHQIDSHIIPEAVITTNLPAPNGYANSKYLAEQLLLHAAHKGFEGMSLARVGQVGGAVQSSGLWNKNEWLPSLILSSLHVGAIPDDIGNTLGYIDWMPIDTLAEVLVELALRNDATTSERPVNVFHPVNQQPLTWKDVRDAFSESLSRHSGKKIKTTPFADWIELVRSDVESASKDVDLKALLAMNPAAKLLDFFYDVLKSRSTRNSLETAITAERMS